jgi:hypothetical protein
VEGGILKITEILIGKLSLDDPPDRRAALVDKINSVIKPPRPATADNVNIRAMYVVNDLVNSHGGQFRREDLSKLCELIVDTPVLIGHNRAETPLARTFHAELEERANVLWLKSYFYWPKSDNQDDLLLKIDSGILKECSISFIYTLPECSLCGEDIRKCPHELGAGPDGPHFIYGGISQVLETSLVYKGSVRGTYITDKLSEIGSPVIATNDIEQNKSIYLNLLDGKTAVLPIALSLDSVSKIKSCPEKIKVCQAIKNNHSYILLQKKAGENSYA